MCGWVFQSCDSKGKSKFSRYFLLLILELHEACWFSKYIRYLVKRSKRFDILLFHGLFYSTRHSIQARDSLFDAITIYRDIAEWKKVL